MPDYDASHYDPPAPVAHVELRRLDGQAVPEQALLLIDTGADVTLVPRFVVEKLGVKLTEVDTELIAFDGSRSRAQAVELDLVFLKRRYRGRYLVVGSEQGVLGRDVLAHIVLLLDGPRGSWDEVQISK